MKKYTFVFAAVAASLLAFSCSKEVAQPVKEEASNNLKITLEADAPDTKSVITSADGTHFTPAWQSGELMKFWPAMTDAVDPLPVGTLENTSPAGSKASFTGTVISMPSALTDGTYWQHFLAVTPASAAGDLSGSGVNRNVTVTLPGTQVYNPAVSLIDPAADILVAQGYKNYGGDVATVSGVKFVREVALVKVDINVASVLAKIGGATSVSSLTLTSSDAGIAGSYSVSSGDQEIYSDPTLKSVTVTPSAAASFVGNVATMYVALARKNVPAGGSLKFDITTDKGTISATRPISNVITLKKGKANFVVNLKSSDDFALGGLYTVTFDTDGGSAISAANVTPGSKVARPADPVKTIALEDGLYIGKFLDPDNTPLDFIDWYKDPGRTELYDFDSAVDSDITLYAKWSDAPVIVDFSDYPSYTGNVIQQTWQYFNHEGLAPGTELTLALKRDITDLTFWWDGSIKSFKNEKGSLSIVGIGTRRTISMKNDGFGVDAGTVRFGKNITLTAAGMTKVAFNMNGTGKFEMLEGSEITGISTTAEAIVKINSGDNTFTLNGGKIYGNTVTSAATKVGTVLHLYGKLYFNAGSEISNNTVIATKAEASIAGGVFLNNNWSTFSFKCAVKGNTASYAGDVTPGKCGQQFLLLDGKKIDTDVEDGTDVTNRNAAPWVAL